MSSLKSAIAILEQETSSTTSDAITAGPVLVRNSHKPVDSYLTRRVEAALDVDFANGSMPA
jgi:hypothetical protein